MGNQKSKGTSHPSIHTKDIKTDTKLSSFRFFPLKSSYTCGNSMARLLPPRDVICKLAFDYLEIYDINQLAQSCKLIYYWLVCDDAKKGDGGFWKRIARRDGFSEFREELSGDECRKMYWKLMESRLIFEKDLNCLESQTYSIRNLHSESYEKFKEFV